MNDEKFELTICDLAGSGTYYADIADELRARDTAQREALARVEAELDAERARGDAAVGDANEAESQLAEALGLLQAIDRDIWPEWESRFGNSAALINVQAFLADYVQAEQQEAHCPSCDGTGDVHRPDGEWLGECPCAEAQEAQGAQAGEFQREDRYIVIKRKDLEAIENSGGSSDLETHEAVRFLAEALDTLQPHLPKRECLVVESDWPEYEPAWAAIQARVVFAERRQMRDISEEEKQAIADRLKSLPPALRGKDHDL